MIVKIILCRILLARSLRILAHYQNILVRNGDLKVVKKKVLKVHTFCTAKNIFSVKQCFCEETFFLTVVTPF